ncbi:hypothetical protein [Chryseobacterium oryzae]|uniref:Por secretion system C-terminal sorting domain-containing protein n=1 Tax=Chryseobacterium oryzae TaxID=2929799 RepID=A0ABY4BK03_9FLAO|nr:hypothetical protein [Chryseobacterium oryzae]UOE39502.1 hypothetical protein MTP08_06930 [Chryseobacterium oryzae]
MKNVFKIISIAGALLISSKAMSKEKDFSISFGNIASQTLSFEVNNAENISLFIYNDADGEIYSEKVGNLNHVTKTYNMGNFEDGTYFLIAESEHKLEKYKIQINRKNMTLEKTPVKEIIKPEFVINGNKVSLKMDNLQGSVNVSVQDLSNNIYFNEARTPKDGNINISFQLNPKTSENYIIAVERNGDIFSRMISLK